jgi:excinuclease ABC subunit B
MMREMGFCSGIENYSVHLTLRPLGVYALCLHYTCLELAVMSHVIHQSLLTNHRQSNPTHVTLPQVRGMYNGDRARKQVLVDHGFRLPSALD